jgi:hypothetical protein
MKDNKIEVTTQKTKPLPKMVASKEDDFDGIDADILEMMKLLVNSINFSKN